MKYLKQGLLCFAAILCCIMTNGQNSKKEFHLLLGGNAYSYKHLEGKTITNNGIENWTNPEEYFTAYFRISKPGIFKISLESLQ
ncbi:protein of unknown function [Flavobacterium gillisiae]|uniref:DUF5077 domain-containing protein n=1 Tax=Flavobacterium gillisiae TaxID=150146 RepID=A0A1H4F732_9FLAO|nr:DUF5077 domain-containing protein [Flavobacterium gillisiae]SEA92730.1 protein of unknown function [Flavobacterium gillisiae]